MYIQGSGDDHELWGMGLTPDIFWAHRDRLLSADRSELESVVATCVSESQKQCLAHRPSAIVAGRMLLCSTSDLVINSQGKLSTNDSTGSEDIAFLIISHRAQHKYADETEQSLLSIMTLEGKKGQAHFLQTILPRSMHFIREHLVQGMRVCIACDTGKDLSVGVAIAALQKYFDDEGNFTEPTLDVIPGIYIFIVDIDSSADHFFS